MSRQVRLLLTPLQAECLLQLAQEADFETFQGNGRRWNAGEAGIDKLVTAIADERRRGRTRRAHPPGSGEK